jgi:hypothetical protein
MNGWMREEMNERVDNGKRSGGGSFEKGAREGEPEKTPTRNRKVPTLAQSDTPPALRVEERRILIGSGCVGGRAYP